MRFSRILLSVAFVLLIVSAALSELGTMDVQVKAGQLRSSPSFLGTVVAPVTYGDKVEAVQQQGDWVDVKTLRNERGWIHQSALTKKSIMTGTGGRTKTGASEQEIALAGKGFNAAVEKQYRSTHANVDFLWVDRMEAMWVSREDMVAFLTAGDVKPSEGGAK
jgi:hypothetical protein